MSEWKPIESAPMNVKSSPGDNGKRGVLVTRWPSTTKPPIVIAQLHADGVWKTGRYKKLPWKPTHWMPLPEPPE